MAKKSGVMYPIDFRKLQRQVENCIKTKKVYSESELCRRAGLNKGWYSKVKKLVNSRKQDGAENWYVVSIARENISNLTNCLGCTVETLVFLQKSPDPKAACGDDSSEKYATLQSPLCNFMSIQEQIERRIRILRSRDLDLILEFLDFLDRYSDDAARNELLAFFYIHGTVRHADDDYSDEELQRQSLILRIRNRLILELRRVLPNRPLDILTQDDLSKSEEDKIDLICQEISPVISDVIKKSILDILDFRREIGKNHILARAALELFLQK